MVTNSVLLRHRDKWYENEDGHYIWTGAVSGSRHPRPSVTLKDGKSKYVARLVCEEEYGDMTGFEACHKPECRNGMCIRPDHLYKGTRQQNCLDVPVEERKANANHASRRRLMNSPTPLDLIPKDAFVAVTNGKFQAKLSFEERCAVLALVTAGVSRATVAATFSIDRRTVAHCANHTSPHYKDVRKRLTELGRDEFIKEYVTESIALRVKDAHGRVQTDQPVERGGPSARASGKAGIQTVKPEQCAYSHRLEIAYFDGSTNSHGDPKETGDIGWHYRDLDDKTAPDMWLHNGPASLMTSQACLAAAEANLTDD